jgi:hypothetical protein
MASFWAANTDRYKSIPAYTTGSGIPSPTNSHPANYTSSDKTSTTIGLAVGLGVGIPLLIGIAALVFFCVRRQRKKKTNANATTEPTELMLPESGYPVEKKGVTASYGFKAELDGTPNINSPGPSEMQDTSVMGSPYGSPLVSPATINEGFKGSDEISKHYGGGKTGQAHEMVG